MSMAWETTDIDVQTVASQHGVQLSDEEAERICVELDHDLIEKNVLRYTEFDDQCDSMMDDIENHLLQTGVIEGEKKYYPPR